MKLKKFFTKKGLFTAIFFAAAFLMLFLNFLTPMLADDYSYHYSWKDNAYITTVGQAFTSMYAHYFRWGGRVVTHLIATLFLLVGKPVFNFANTAVYLWMTLLIYRFVNIKNKELNPLLYFLIHLGLWFTLPVYGQNILWLIGSCNYMWATTFLLTYLWPLYRYSLTGEQPSNKAFPVFYLLLGLLAGWGNENTSGAGILFAVSLLFLSRKNLSSRLPVWVILGTLGQITGFLFMLGAPGNFLRLNESMEATGPFLKYAIRLGICNSMIWDYLLYFFMVYIFLLVLLFFRRQEKLPTYTAALFGICSLACNYAMIASPEYPERAVMGSALFLLMGILFCASLLFSSCPLKWPAALTACFTAVFCFQFIFAILDIGYTYRLCNRRIASVIEQRDAGVMDIVTYRIEPYTKWNPMFGLEDLQGYETHWLNGNFCAYFGIDTILAFPEENTEN